jgi:hypothetical protein
MTSVTIKQLTIKIVNNLYISTDVIYEVYVFKNGGRTLFVTYYYAELSEMIVKTLLSCTLTHHILCYQYSKHGVSNCMQVCSYRCVSFAVRYANAISIATNTLFEIKVVSLLTSLLRLASCLLFLFFLESFCHQIKG